MTMLMMTALEIDQMQGNFCRTGVVADCGDADSVDFAGELFHQKTRHKASRWKQVSQVQITIVM